MADMFGVVAVIALIMHQTLKLRSKRRVSESDLASSIVTVVVADHLRKPIKRAHASTLSPLTTHPAALNPTAASATTPATPTIGAPPKPVHSLQSTTACTVVGFTSLLCLSLLASLLTALQIRRDIVSFYVRSRLATATFSSAASSPFAAGGMAGGVGMDLCVAACGLAFVGAVMAARLYRQHLQPVVKVGMARFEDLTTRIEEMLRAVRWRLF
ncbi:hypothetical protein HDU96_000261 [Phlyctochytrium bullatum]|nr:hypothetical protein HDU96_000261 [Phlyctochytrium bullatum]